MRKPHIAIFTLPIPACVNPTFSVVRTLVRRGYRVTYVTSERYESEVQNLGGEVLKIPVLKKWYHQNRPDALADDLYDLGYRTLSLTSSFYEANRPDLVLHDGSAFAGIVVAGQARVPAIRTASELALDDENLSKISTTAEFREILRASGEQCRRFLTEHGIHRQNARFDRSDRSIYFYIRDLQIGSHEGYNSGTLYAGRCAAERPVSGSWNPERAEGRRIVLITASTCYIQGIDYFKMCIDALSGLQYYLLIAIGENNDPSSFDPAPGQYEIIKGIPQLLVMPHVNLIIGLGGTTTLMEAAYHGVPLLMLTHGYPDPELYADRAQAIGLGLHLRKDACSPTAIRRSAVELVEGSRLRDEVIRIQDAVKRSAGGEEVANWIEEQLR